MNSPSDNIVAYQRYRRHFLRRDSISFSILMVLFVLFNLLLFKADAHIWPSGPVHDWLVALRCFYIISSLMAVIALFYTKRPEVFDRWTLGWGLMLALTNNLVILSRPAAYTGNTLPELVAVIALFSVMPDRMPHRILPSVLMAAGSLSLLFTVKTLPEPVALLSLVFSYLVALVMGFWVSRVFFRYRREAYFAREELEVALHEAEAAHQAKSEFLALVSHEIRTPLNALVGFSSLARSTGDPEKLQQYHNILEQSSIALMELVNDILDMSKLEAGRMSTEPLPFNLHRMTGELDGQYRPQAEQKQVRFQVLTDPHLPDWISADPIRIRQILANLLSNAVKFTAQGGIVCTLKAAGPDAEGLPLLEITVQDSGIGIPATKRDQLFKPFQQIDPTITRKFGGTGLGLAIVAGLVRVMGGSLSIVSSEGGGTTVCVSLPFHPAVAPSDDVDAISQMSGSASILVVEDNAFNRLLLEDILTSWNHRVTTAENGEQGLLLLEEQRFDLLLLDIRMPGIDGIEVARQVRQQEARRNGQQMPVIAVTADADATTREQCLAAGMQDVLPKPVSPARLAEAIALHCGIAVPPEAELQPLLSAKTLAGLGGNPERVRQYLAILLQDISENLEALQEACNRDEREELKRRAHTLKGLYAQFDNEKPAELAAWLQNNAATASGEQLRQQLLRLKSLSLWDQPDTVSEEQQ